MESSEQSIYKFSLARVAQWLVILSVLVFFMVYYKSVVQPFVLALVIWYLISQLKALIGRIKINQKPLPSWLRGTLALVITIVMGFLIVELLTYNVDQIQKKMPEYDKTLDQFLANIPKVEGLEDVSERIQKRLQTIDLQPLASRFLGSITSALGNLMLIIIYIIFLLIEERIFVQKLKVIFPDENRYNKVARILSRINSAINSYFSVKTAMSLLTGFLSYIILVIIGVDFPILWAFLIFLFNYIPYVGSMVATLLPSMFAIFQFGSFGIAVLVLVLVQVVQFAVGSLIEPRFMGKTLNLSPVVVVLALSFWGSIWGVLGMLLSVPITSIIVIVLGQIPETRNLAVFLSETGEIRQGDGDQSSSTEE